MGHPFFFYSLAAMAGLGALAVVVARNPVYAVLSLVAALFALSGLFLLLEATFVALIQILVYAGAILVLFLFVVMLSDLSPEALLRTRASIFRLTGALFGLFFLWQTAAVVKTFTLQEASIPEAFPGSIREIGKALFTTYALPFEVASLLLLVGVIGAIVLAKK